MAHVDRLPFSVRVYGPSIGHGSFARVAAGMCEGLEAHGMLAGFVPVDIIEDEGLPHHGGVRRGLVWDEAPCAVYVGPPTGVGVMPRWHEERWALLPANSSWMPENLLRSMWPHVTGFLAPSQWAAGVLRGYVARLGEELGPRDVSVWQHGVGREFVPRVGAHEARVREYEGGALRVLHMASTRLERKGTAELVEAWCSLLDAGRLGKGASLRLVLDEPPNWPKDVAATAARFIRAGDAAAAIRILDRQGIPSEVATEMYQAHHVVCQPSRGEGFGLVPLEARASGVPVVMTACTGHGEHAPSPDGLSGTLVVPHGELAPIDDGPGALAPTVSVAKLRSDLEYAWALWPGLARSAREAAPAVGEQWSWAAVTERWLKERA